MVSRECSQNSSLQNGFIWKVTDTQVPNYDTHLNSKQEITIETPQINEGEWIENNSLQLPSNSLCEFTLSWNEFYRFSFNITSLADHITESEGVCILLENIKVILPVTTRYGITTMNMSSAPCSVTSTSMAVFIQHSCFLFFRLFIYRSLHYY